MDPLKIAAVRFFEEIMFAIGFDYYNIKWKDSAS